MCKERTMHFAYRSQHNSSHEKYKQSCHLWCSLFVGG